MSDEGEQQTTEQPQEAPKQELAVPTKVAKIPIVAHDSIMPIVPRDVDEAYRFAEMVWKAGLAPESYKNDPRMITIGILSSMELGVPPLTGLRGIAIINGRPAVWGDLAIALVQSKGVIANTEVLWFGSPFEDDWKCRFIIWRKGQENPYVGEFSVLDAKRANLWMNPKKKPWIEYPQRMLLNRARAFALRDGFSDCLAGLAIAEEAQDLPAAPKAIAEGVLDDAVDAEVADGAAA